MWHQVLLIMSGKLGTVLPIFGFSCDDENALSGNTVFTTYVSEKVQVAVMYHIV